jgi:hypothetical protein
MLFALTYLIVFVNSITEFTCCCFQTFKDLDALSAPFVKCPVPDTDVAPNDHHF